MSINIITRLVLLLLLPHIKTPPNIVMSPNIKTPPTTRIAPLHIHSLNSLNSLNSHLSSLFLLNK